MKSKINFYRIILNILFYIFYVLTVSVLFSFIFPTILVILGQKILSPSDPIFDNIQIIIFILVLIFSLIFRKYFYLPVFNKKDKGEDYDINKNIKKNKINLKDKIEKEDKVSKNKIKKENMKIEKKIELDIKIGKEIK